MSFTAALTRSVLVSALLLPGAALAEEDIIGSGEYQRSCLACHGAGGRGNGPMTKVLNVEVPDLTKLAERDEGNFPLRHVVEIIDGRADVAAHGARTMPVWGDRYAASIGGPAAERGAAEQLVRGRILELVNYLVAIQQPGDGPLLAPAQPQTAGTGEQQQMPVGDEGQGAR